MNLMGSVSIGSARYFLYINDVKAKETFLLVSPVHKEDRFKALGEIMDYPIIKDVTALKSSFDENYVTEGIQRTKVSGKFKAYNRPSILENIQSVMAYARMYKFSANNISVDKTTAYFATVTKEFSGADTNLYYSFTSVDGFTQRMEIIYSDVKISLEPADFSFSLKNLNFTEVSNKDRKQLSVSSVKVIDYPTLRGMIDLNWYEENGIKKKDYQSVESIYDFEINVMNPFIKYVIDCHLRGVPAYCTLDIETTGLNIYNLSSDNEEKDHTVAIILCWELDKAKVIFTDMEYFDSIPNDYVMKRLSEALSLFNGSREIIIYEPSKDEDSVTTIESMNFFMNNDELVSLGTDSVTVPPNEHGLQGVKPVVVTIERDWINLINHNSPFDAKGFYAEGYEIYYDDDTLQMAFNLNPGFTKHSRKLKALTHRIMGHETPELSDILGKGNEDKYRYLTDKEVAKIYGGADGDYTLRLFFYLRGLMSDSMYKFYKRQDMRIMNVLVHSEYYGMNTFEDKVIELADQTWQNLEILKTIIYQYTGAFIDYKNKRDIVEKARLVGVIKSEEEYLQVLGSIIPDPEATHEFDLKGSEIRKVMYDIMHYPVYGMTKGAKPLASVDKFVMEKLAKKERSETDHSFRELKNDVYVYGVTKEEYEQSVLAKGEKMSEHLVLIKAKEFNKKKYPLALLLQKYGELNKEYTSYYKPLKETNMEGKIFKSYSLSRIETRRIMNPGQTMKGNLKALVKAYTDDHYLLDFDMSQVEYRIMVSIAKFQAMIIKMNNPEKDYHTETAALVHNMPAHKVSKKLRKLTKSVSFGVPYGLGVRKLCERLFGEVNEQTLLDTNLLLGKWKSANGPVMDMLNEERANALVEQIITDDLRDFMDMWERDENKEYVLDNQGNKVPIPVGFVFNKYGFYRTFNLSNMDKKKESSIRNAAGNFPIQCFAAELFRIILMRFYDRCVAEGIKDKVIWHMLIHDELLCSVHKSVHPFFIYKIVKEACMVSMKGHTKYFVGINIGNTWAETKDDAREAPVYFVDRIVKRWDEGEFANDPKWFDDPWEYIRPYREQYVEDRIGEVLHELQPNMDNEPIDIPYLLEKFDNYTVRAYVNDYPMNVKVPPVVNYKDQGEVQRNDDLRWISCFESWIIKVYGEGKLVKDIDGNIVPVLSGCMSEPVKPLFSKLVNFSDLFDDDEEPDSVYDNWTFDPVEVEDTYGSTTFIYSEDDYEEDKFEFDFSKKGNTVADLVVVEKNYKSIKVWSNQIIINVKKLDHITKCKKYLTNDITTVGKTIIFKDPLGRATKWLKIKDSTDLKALDEFVQSLK